MLVNASVQIIVTASILIVAIETATQTKTGIKYPYLQMHERQDTAALIHSNLILMYNMLFLLPRHN